MRLSPIPYLRWAKTEAGVGEILLTASAVPPVSWQDLGYDPRELELARYSPYGEEDLLAALGDTWDLPKEGVLLAASTTHAHFCFAASCLAHGDRVLYESPGYLPLIDSLSMLGVEAVAYHRRHEAGYGLPMDEIEELASVIHPRLLLVTHLHNPSGVALTDEEVRFLGELCDRHDFEVLCDEIYRPFLDPDPGPLHRRHPSIISVAGLNKVHGLPLLRVGWGYATPERVELARRILDATTIHNSTLSDQVARFAYIQKRKELEARARRIAADGWEVVGEWLAGSPLDVVRPASGLISFPRIPSRLFEDGDEFRAAALEVGVGVTPGRFFEESRHVRIGCGLPPDRLREATRRLDTLLAGA